MSSAATVARKSEGVVEITYPKAGELGTVTLTDEEAAKLASETEDAELAATIRAVLGVQR